MEASLASNKESNKLTNNKFNTFYKFNVFNIYKVEFIKSITTNNNNDLLSIYTF
jgi:hypothetical protein